MLSHSRTICFPTPASSRLSAVASMTSSTSFSVDCNQPNPTAADLPGPL